MSEFGNDPFEQADAALRHAAIKVVQRARETGTPIITRRDGEIRSMSAEECGEFDGRRKANGETDPLKGVG